MNDSKPVSLVAVAARREEIIALLSQRFSDDVIDVDELDRRVDAAHRVVTLAELSELVADLEPERGLTVASTATTLSVTQDPSRPAERSMWMILGRTEKRGRWTVPSKLTVRSFLGGSVLDFREADFAPGITELRIRTLLGRHEIIVPPDLDVELDLNALLGHADDKEPSTTSRDPNRPRLIITGLAVLGGVDIKRREVGETAREARTRRRFAKREQKSLSNGSQPQLPPGDNK